MATKAARAVLRLVAEGHRCSFGAQVDEAAGSAELFAAVEALSPRSWATARGQAIRAAKAHAASMARAWDAITKAR
jgi:hypothetical protein